MIKRQCKPRAGLTLIEVLIGIFLFSIMIIVLSQIFRLTFRTYKLQTNQGTLQLQDRTALDRTTRQIRQSLGVAASNGTNTSSDSVLVLQLASIDASSVIIPSTYDYVIYKLSTATPKKYQETVVADAASSRKSGTKTLANDVDSLVFTYYSKTNTVLSSGFTATKRINILLNTSKTNYAKTVPINYSAQATIRNQ